MNVHDAIVIGIDEKGRDDFHVAGKQDEIDIMLFQNFQDSSIIGLAFIIT